jgi:hypothetical protein
MTILKCENSLVQEPNSQSIAQQKCHPAMCGGYTIKAVSISIFIPTRNSTVGSRDTNQTREDERRKEWAIVVRSRSWSCYLTSTPITGVANIAVAKPSESNSNPFFQVVAMLIIIMYMDDYW